MKDADILTLPCVTPWGTPPAGVLFTPEAFARYSVSSRTVSDALYRSSQCIGRHARQHDISICLHLSIRCGLLRRRLRSMQMLSFLRRLRLRPRQVRSTKICDECRAETNVHRSGSWKAECPLLCSCCRGVRWRRPQYGGALGLRFARRAHARFGWRGAVGARYR